jgi:hypothetical protein
MDVDAACVRIPPPAPRHGQVDLQWPEMNERRAPQPKEKTADARVNAVID